MSGFFVGLTAAVLGNVVIGTGQCLQKYALNRIQKEWEVQSKHQEALESNDVYSGFSSAISVRARGSSISHVETEIGTAATSSGSGSSRHTKKTIKSGPRARYKDKTWVFGLLLNYLGEMFGNSVALSYLSASVVAPLGIISVLVNMILAQRLLGERITRSQRHGFMLITAGVGSILLVAPRKSPAKDGVQFIQLITESGIISLFSLIIVAQGILIYCIRTGRESLLLYVVVASLFGSMNVMVSKIFTMYLRLRMVFSAMPNPADLVAYGPFNAMKASPLIGRFTTPQIIACIVLAASIVGQESFRQQALGKYSVVEFQPIFFATYNVVATLLGLIIFKELESWFGAVVFFTVFLVGIGLVLYGSRFLQKAKAVELPSHIRFQKENLNKIL